MIGNAERKERQDRKDEHLFACFAAFAFPILLALVFLALHLPYLPSSLEDVDSINFALGMRRFDVAHHQPHPPGYPLFILAANAAHAAIPSEAKALAAISVVSGALGVFAIFALYRRLTDGEADGATGAAIAAALAMTAPLYWFTAARPLSDAMGLAAAVAVQALILAAETDPALAIAAFCAGVAVGIRSQVLWLTFPLLVYRCLVSEFGARHDARDGARHRIRGTTTVVAAFAAGGLAWFIPLVMLTGGPAAYWRALFDQGAEDLSGIRMLWTTPTARELVDALYYAFVAPWAVWPLAVVVLVLASAGAVVLVRRNRRVLALIAVLFGPYLVFDLLFQETFTSRYALPLVVPIAFLATTGLRALPATPALIVAIATAMFGAHVGGRSIAAYSRQPAPAFQLLADMRAAAAASPVRPVLAPDRRESFDLRRPLAWMGVETPALERQLTAPPQHEWLEAVKYWNGGGRAPLWFVVDPRRAAIDLVQHGDPVAYEWSEPYPVLMSGTRPNDAYWFRVNRPEWYVGEGWALTPESAGVANADHRGLAIGAIHGWIRRDAADGAAFVLGGRNFEAAARPRLTVALGSKAVIASPVAPGSFLNVLRLPAGSSDGRGDYIPLTIATDPPAHVAIEQFDVSASRGVLGFGDGWYEHELNPTTGRQWRWLSGRGELRYIAPVGGNVLRIKGESPLVYYSKPSRIVVKAGSAVLRDLTVSDDFAIDVEVPPSYGPSTIVIETDQTYVPAEHSWRGSADRRRLGLRIYSCELRRVSPASARGTEASSPPAR